MLALPLPALGLVWHLAAPWPGQGSHPTILHLSAMSMEVAAGLQGLQESPLPLTCQSVRAKAQVGATSTCQGTGRKDQNDQCKRCT